MSDSYLLTFCFPFGHVNYLVLILRRNYVKSVDSRQFFAL